jgi:peptide/nickel transport system substrate-binding protein
MSRGNARMLEGGPHAAAAPTTSEDPQTIVDKIKQDAAWSDGTPVSADDFEYLWRNLNGTVKGNDQRQDRDRGVQGTIHGLEVDVLRPAAGPVHGRGARRLEHGLDKNPERIPVNGPYRVSAWEQGQSLTLARNDKYFGPNAHLDSIVFQFLPESTTQPAALQNNEVDLIYPQPQLDLVLPLYAKPTYLAVRDRFANVGDNATQEGPFWNSGLWAQKAA